MEDLRRQEVRELARLTAPLTAAQQAFFQGEYGRHRRNPTTALVLCVLLGGFGAHYFYFGRHREGVLRLLLSWSLVPAVAALFEARTIGKRAMRYNAALANELLLALGDTVHEQPREVAALETLSVPMALPINGRAALSAPDVTDAATHSAEDALIAGAYAGREAARGATSGHLEAAFNGVANGRDSTTAYATADSNLPASEYDTWYDQALHGAPAAETNDQASGAPVEGAAGMGPDAPQWVPVPEWPAPASQPARTDPVEAWVMPDLSHQDGLAAAAPQQLSAADLLDDESLNLFPQLAGNRADELSPGVAAAAAGAAAAWSGSGQESDSAARAEREPVFMYEAAPASRRPSVHYGPPAASAANSDWAQHGTGAPSLPRRIGEDVGLASLGSLLASGLADLLRERPGPPRTRPLTQPHEAQAATYRAPSVRRLEPIIAPPAATPADTADPWAVSASIRAPLAESPHLAPADEEPAFTPTPDTSTAPDHEWLALGAVGAAIGAGTLWAHDSAHQQPHTSSDVDVEPLAPESALAPVAEPEPAYSLQPEPVTPAVPAPAAYVSTPSQGLRRRITHRLFVRKMAVLEGKVVAESSAERQVELVDDDAVMAERVRQATQSAAREALEHLLQLAPSEALPAVRAQLLSLDLEAN